MTTDHLPESAGVYLLTCSVTGDTYVGCASNIAARVLSYRNKAVVRGQAISDHIAAHGVNFRASVLELTTQRERFRAEKRWIEQLRPTLNGHRGSDRDGPDPRGKINIAARVRKSLVDRLEEIGDADERTFSFMVEKAIEHFLDTKFPKR